MSKNTGYFSVSRAQWQHIGFNDVHKIRAQQANENVTKPQDGGSAKEKSTVREQVLVLED
ncbi:MAG: hypothetical protein JWM96_127 [Alphaproteobacteria bacterium]|nr:hypothetical protein [Alphaproteobacteria bacterium]